MFYDEYGFHTIEVVNMHNAKAWGQEIPRIVK